MHELSFAQQILETVQREAAGFGGVRVTRVKLRADEYLALEPASLRFCLDRELAADRDPQPGSIMRSVARHDTANFLQARCKIVLIASLLSTMWSHA